MEVDFYDQIGLTAAADIVLMVQKQLTTATIKLTFRVYQQILVHVPRK